MNDTNSVSVSLEYFSNLNTNSFTNKMVDAQNELYLNYKNTSIKDLSINPYLFQTLDKSIELDNMAIGVNLGYSL
jgi:hypothetical protein